MSPKENSSNIHTLTEEVKRQVDRFTTNDDVAHPFDLKELLLKIRDLDEDTYFSTLKYIPAEMLAEVIAELPSHLQLEASEGMGVKKLAKITTEMETDDAADFLQNIDKTEDVLNKINLDDQKVIRELISYNADVAGAYMQTELFSVGEDEVVADAIARLRQMKKSGEIQGIGQVYITKVIDKFICSIGIEELVFLDITKTFKVSLESGEIDKNIIAANHFDDIKDVVSKVSDYNLHAIPIIDDEDKLLGRITSDDIYDLIQTHATEEMFGMAGLNAEVEAAEDIHQAAKQRALWLGINLFTAIAASMVVGFYEQTIQSFVALAVLMPIVASMGGNAGTQTLTVTVRRLSIGEIDLSNAFDTLKKEISLSLMNGLLFALVIGVLSYFWFKIPMLGVVIAVSTIINLFIAGFSGAIIPLVLDRLNIDPAIASTVLLTTITDIIGFFSFLGLAKLMLI